jgi:hypothetical protein
VLEEVIHGESHQAHEVEQELPHESIEEEDLDEAHHDEGQVHEEGLIESNPPHEDDMLVFSPSFDENEVTQVSSPTSHEDKNLVSCTLFLAFDSYDASFHVFESEEVLEESLDVISFYIIKSMMIRLMI